MKNVGMLFLMMACLAALTAGSSVTAAPGAHAISAQGKATSDQAMQAGLSALQAAAGAVQGGNTGQVGGDLQSAISAMTSARPIYHGYRERSIHSAEAAIKELQSNKKNAEKRVAAHIARAIQDVQTALSTN